MLCSRVLQAHESKIRAIVIRSYIIDKFLEMGCPEAFVYQIVPSQKEIERRLMIDILESRYVRFTYGVTPQNKRSKPNRV